MSQRTSKFIKIDFTIQLLLIIPFIILGTIGIVMHSSLMYALLFQFCIGIWQTLSCLIWSITTQHASRIRYLWTIVIYFSISAILAGLANSMPWGSDITTPLFLLWGILIPTILAFCYLNITFQEMQHYSRRVKTFWDL